MKIKIKELCAQKGITQKELSELTGLTEVSLSKLNNPTKDTIEKIANALNVDVSKLFCREEKKLKIICKGEIELGSVVIPCYVLEDGKRVLSGRKMQEALKMVDVEEGKQTAGTRLIRYLSQKTLNPFIFNDKDVDHFSPITCYDGNSKINGAG